MKQLQTIIFEKLKLNNQSKLKNKKIYFPESKKELQDYCVSIIENTPKGQICNLNVIDTSKMFSNCYNLTKIELPDSVTVIGASAFGNCESLTKLELK